MTKLLKWTDALPEQRAQHLMMVYSNGQGWTSSPPTKEGWYWVFLHEKVQIVEVGKHDDGGLVYWESGILYNHRDLSFVDFWLGPLPVPEPPTEGE